jgi:hypothetical protein
MTLTLYTQWLRLTMRQPWSWLSIALLVGGEWLGVSPSQAALWGWTGLGVGQLFLHSSLRQLVGVPSLPAVGASTLLTFLLAAAIGFTHGELTRSAPTALHLTAMGITLAYMPISTAARSFSYLLLALLAPTLSYRVAPLRWFDATPDPLGTHGFWIAGVWVVLALAAAKFHEVRDPR